MPTQTEKNLKIDDLIDMLVDIEHEHGNLPVRVFSASEGSFPLFDVRVVTTEENDEDSIGNYCLVE